MSVQNGGNMGWISVDVALANNREVQQSEAGSLAKEQVRRLRITGVVDTGASSLVLPESVANQLGLPDAGTTAVQYADRRRETRRIVDQVEVEILGRRGTFNAVVEPARSDALIGAIVLEVLDLIPDCRAQKLSPRDPNTILTELE